MKKIIPLVLCLFLPVCISFAETDIPAGDVFGVWESSGSPYNVAGDITLPSDSTLIIEPGVQIVFLGYFKMEIYGLFKCIGTLTDSILFTSSDTSIVWGGLKIRSDACTLKYCIVEYGEGTGAPPNSCGGGLFIRANAVILNSSIGGGTQKLYSFLVFNC